MLPVSKILTLNKGHVLRNLAGALAAANDPALDYFQLGYPLVDPPRIRGAIALTLNLRFFADNAAFFECGSPIDIGALRFGLIAVDDLDSMMRNLICDRHRFQSLVADLSTLPGEVLSLVLRHRRAPAAAHVLERHFERRVVDFMMATDEPCAWMFEFSLRKGYRVAPEHVDSIAFPNTYASAPLFRVLRTTLGARIRQYNPRLGLENVCA